MGGMGPEAGEDGQSFEGPFGATLALYPLDSSEQGHFSAPRARDTLRRGGGGNCFSLCSFSFHPPPTYSNS